MGITAAWTVPKLQSSQEVIYARMKVCFKEANRFVDKNFFEMKENEWKLYGGYFCQADLGMDYMPTLCDVTITITTQICNEHCVKFGFNDGLNS